MRETFIGAIPLLATLLLAIPALAQSEACEAPEHDQFDFWVGTWDVFNPEGEKAGENVIEKRHAGCALVENWSGTSGSSGTSVNFYDTQTGRWHQTWMGSWGQALFLNGGLDEGGSMVLASDPDVSPINRITWTPNDDGTVRQHWQISEDGGETWETAFDGTYVRREE